MKPEKKEKFFCRLTVCSHVTGYSLTEHFICHRRISNVDFIISTAIRQLAFVVSSIRKNRIGKS
jgi:hypothetical protein